MKKKVTNYPDKSRVVSLTIVIGTLFLIMFFLNPDFILFLPIIFIIITTIYKLFNKILYKKPFFEPSKSNLIYGILLVISAVLSAFIGFILLVSIGFGAGGRFKLILAYSMIVLSPSYVITGIIMIFRYIKYRLI